MRKKKNDKKKIIFLLIILLIILVSLVIMIDDNRKLTRVEKFIKDGGITISNFVSTPFLSIKKTFFTESKENYDKQIEELENQGINSEILNENKKLKEQLELNNTLSEREYINATVINRNVAYWFNEITINKGSKAGIKEGMAVINSSGLIGKIIKVSDYTSIVKLLTDEHMINKISVKIEYDDKFVYGLLSNYKDGQFIIDGISNNIEIKENAKVVTSGLTDLFPSGILIGYVKEITSDNFDLAKSLKVTSDVDFDDIYYVTILIRNVDEIND